MKHRGEKYPLIYREKSDIFNKSLGGNLYTFSMENSIKGREKFAVCLILEEGNLHKNKLVFTYLLGGVNVFIH